MNRTKWLAAIGLAVFSTTTFAQTTEETIRQLREQIEILNRRLTELENRQATSPPSMQSAPATAATEPAAADEKASWTEKVSLGGDLRLRYENLDEEGVDDRNRDRVRARAAITAKPVDDLELGFGLSTSQGGDPVSSNQTLGSGNSRKDIYLDLAYVQWTGIEGLKLTAGKFRNLLYRAGDHGLLWDSDWNPEGAGVAWESGPFFANAVGTWLESDSNLTEEFSWGGQGGVKFPLTDALELTAGIGYFAFDTAGKGSFFGDDDDFFGNSNAGGVYLYDYHLLEGFAELGFDFRGLPLRVFVDYVHNSDADDFDTGWAAGLGVGEAKTAGSWEASWTWQSLEADAVLGLLTDSDFGRGGTDNEGHVFRGGYAVTDQWKLALTYYLTEVDEDATGVATDINRFQLDLEFRY